MFEFLGAIFTGGLTGLLGTALQGVASYFQKKQEHAQKVELRRLDMEMMDREWEHRDRAAAREGEIRLQESADGLQGASYGHDSASYSKGLNISSVFLRGCLVLVDVLRGIVRPALTVLLCWLVWDTRAEVKAVLDASGVAAISPKTALALYHEVVTTILYVATTALVWWFGGRSRAIKGERK
jgi:hypothetical protein